MVDYSSKIILSAKKRTISNSIKKTLLIQTVQAREVISHLERSQLELHKTRLAAKTTLALSPAGFLLLLLLYLTVTPKGMIEGIPFGIRPIHRHTLSSIR